MIAAFKKEVQRAAYSKYLSRVYITTRVHVDFKRGWHCPAGDLIIIK